MDSRKFIETFSLSISIVVFWIFAFIKSWMFALSYGTDQYIGRSLITLVGFMFAFFIYPFIFIFSMYDSKQGSTVLLYSVMTYAVIFVVGVIIDKLMEPNSKRTPVQQTRASRRLVRRR